MGASGKSSKMQAAIWYIGLLSALPDITPPITLKFLEMMLAYDVSKENIASAELVEMQANVVSANLPRIAGVEQIYRPRQATGDCSSCMWETMRVKWFQKAAHRFLLCRCIVSDLTRRFAVFEEAECVEEGKTCMFPRNLPLYGQLEWGEPMTCMVIDKSDQLHCARLMQTGRSRNRVSTVDLSFPKLISFLRTAR